MKHLVLAAALAFTPNASPPTVVIDDFAFRPQSLTITAGQTVHFVNHDQEAHTITSSTKLFDSGGVDTDASWDYRFTKPGRYSYFCALHPYMKGVVVVRTAGAGS
jgi:plastocyanin